MDVALLGDAKGMADHITGGQACCINAASRITFTDILPDQKAADLRVRELPIWTQM